MSHLYFVSINIFWVSRQICVALKQKQIASLFGSGRPDKLSRVKGGCVRIKQNDWFRCSNVYYMDVEKCQILGRSGLSGAL